MEEKEPPWRAELLEALERAVEHWYHSTDEDLLDVLQPHIQAAEQRGRREALTEVRAEIDALKDDVLEMKARGIWKLGFAGALARATLIIDSAASESP